MGRKQEQKPRPRWAVWADRVVYVAVLVVVLMPGGVLDHWPVAKWRWLEDAGVWPTIERRDLHVALDPPGGFEALTNLQLDVTDDTFLLLLNEHLRVERATAWDRAGEPVAAEVTHLYGTFERYHREARVLRIDLDARPADGRITLQLDYAGEASHGPDGSDWRGLLLVDEHEVRMSEQTVFAPQVPAAWQSPGVQGSPGTLTVLTPPRFEVFAPGTPHPPARDADAQAALVADLDAHITWPDHTLWRFDLDRPGTLSILGGERQRHESVAGDARLVTLLRDEHAHLAEPFLDEARDALDTFARLWGPAGGGSLGIFEMVCREGHSYNWAGDSVITFDRWALSSADEVPLAKLSHEVGHLWWGQRVEGRGDGERVLTEGLAEWASWRWLRERDAEEARRSIRGAADDRAQLLEQDRDLALRDVTFRSAGYTGLAYSKAPLVFRWLEHVLGAAAMDAALTRYATEHAASTASLDELLDALAVRRPGGPTAGRLVHAPWFEHAGDVRVTLTMASWADGTLTARVVAELLGGAGPEFLEVDVPLLVLDTSGQRHVFAVTLTGLDTIAALPMPAEPAAVWLDPDGVLPVPGRGLVVLDGPRLAASEPAAETEVALGPREIVLTFDRPVVFPDDVQTLRGRLKEGHDDPTPPLLDARREDDGRRVVLVTRPLSPGRSWRLGLGRAFEDARGVPVEGDLVFRTAPGDDTTAPEVASTWPTAGGQVAADAREVTLTFSETMRTMTGFKNGDIADRLDDHGWHYPPIEMPRWSDDQVTLTVPLSEPLVPGRTYCLPFGSERWEDLSGNGLVPFDFTFTAASP